MAEHAFPPAGPINLSDPSEAKLYTYGRVEAVIIAAVNPAVLLIGLLGNLGLLFVVARVRRMRTVFNVYLLDLSLAGTVQLVLGSATALARYRASPVYGDAAGLGRTGCAVVALLRDATTWAGITFAVVLVVVLHYAVCRPHRFARFRRKSRAVKVSAAVWALSLAAALCFLPAWSGFAVHEIAWPEEEEEGDPAGGDLDAGLRYGGRYPDTVGVCSPRVRWLLTVHDLVQPLAFFACLFGNTAVFADILRAVRAQLRSVRPRETVTAAAAAAAAATTKTTPAGKPRSTAATAAVKRSADRFGMTRMIAVCSLPFYVLPMPYHCRVFAGALAELSGGGRRALDPGQLRSLEMVSLALLNVTPAVCPYIYVLLNTSYRSATVEAFTRWGRRRRTALPVTRAGGMSTLGK